MIIPWCSKTSLKRQVVCETRVARTSPCNVRTFFFLKLKQKRFSNSRTSILHLCCSNFTIKVVLSLLKPTTRYMCTLWWFNTQLHVHVHVNGSVHAKSGGRLSRLAGSHSPQRLFFTESSMHGISVTNCKWSDHRDHTKQF